MSDTTRSIFHSAFRFFSGTMLSRISGMIRDICMAYFFGTQGSVAALLVAFRFAHLFRRILGEGAMQTALIPHFEELRKDNEKHAGEFFRDLTLSLTSFLILIIAVIMGALLLTLFSNILSEGNQEIAWLTFLMMPSLLFICLFGINASLLQCQKSYFYPSVAPVLFNLAWIIGILFCSKFPINQAMSVLSIFVIIACAAQWIVTVPQSYIILKNFGVLSFWKGASICSANVLRLASPLLLGIVGVAAAQVNNAMDAVFARIADLEGPAYLWYAIRLQQLPLGLFGVALSGALLPPLARALKAGDFTRANHFLDFATRRTIGLMLPITAALFIFGDGCIQLIYGHGDFTNESTLGTTQCLWGYSFGLVPMALVLILAPAFYAKGDYKTPSQASVGSMAINIVLNTILVVFLGLGAASVAFATSVSAFVNLFWLAIAFKKSQPERLTNQTLLIDSGKVAIAVLTASFAVIFADMMLWQHFSFIEILNGTVSNQKISLFNQLIRLSVNGTLFIGIIWGTAYAIKAKDIIHLAKFEAT